MTIYRDPFNGDAAEWVGDTDAAKAGTQAWNPLLSFQWTGRNPKNNPQTSWFVCWDIGNIALGSRIDGVNLRLHSNSNAGNGNYHAGVLLPDGVWNLNGFAREQDRTTGPFYLLANKFPNDGTAIPHAAQTDAFAIEPGIIVDDAWSTPVPIPCIIGTGVQFRIGDGIGGETFTAFFTDATNQIRNWQNVDKLGFVLNVNSGASSFISFYMKDSASSRAPELEVHWSPNRPDITSTPTGIAWVGCLYEYQVEAIPWILGDQTNGNYLGLTYSLVDFVPGQGPPDGMTIDPNTGLIEWTPTLEQATGNPFVFVPVTVRVTNEGDAPYNTWEQAFSIGLVFPASPSITSTPGTSATPFVEYQYQAVADNPVEPCQDPSVTWELTDFPAGAIVSPGGLVTWTPTLAQSAVIHSFTLLVTNAYEQTDTQSWTVRVDSMGHLEGEVDAAANLSGTVNAGPSLAGEVVGGPNLEGEVESGPNLEGEVEAGPLTGGGVRVNRN